MTENNIIIMFNILISALLTLVLFVLRGIKHSINKLWENLDRHRLDRKIHPDIDRIRRLEKQANGRAEK